MFDRECSFCAEIEGDNSFLKHLIDKEFPNRILFKTDKFIVLPSLGQFIEGYLLVISINHFPSMGHIPSNHFKELERIINITSNILERKYCQPIIFEHGAVSKTLMGGCCIDHAHVHIVPYPIDILNDINKNLAGKEIEQLIELKQYIGKGVPYIFYESQLGLKMVFDATGIQSQYCRRILAKSNRNKDIWDWLAFPEEEKLKKTYFNLRDEFKGI